LNKRTKALDASDAVEAARKKGSEVRWLEEDSGSPEDRGQSRGSYTSSLRLRAGTIKEKKTEQEACALTMCSKGSWRERVPGRG
jgi:hypothetical protein